MSEELKQGETPEQEPAKARKKPEKPKSLKATMWDAFLGFLPSPLRPFFEFLQGKLRVIRRHSTTVLVILGVGIIATIGACSWYYNRQMQSLEFDKTVIAKERDVAIDQRDKAKAQLAPWVQLATSHFKNTPLTESLSALREHFLALKANEPRFQLFLNGSLVSDGEVIQLPPSRRIGFTVVNATALTAESIAIDVNSTLAISNLMFQGWHLQAAPKRLEKNSIVQREGLIHLRVICDHNTMGHGGFESPEITISTNCPVNSFPIEMTVSSKASKAFPYRLTLKL